MKIGNEGLGDALGTPGTTLWWHAEGQRLHMGEASPKTGQASSDPQEREPAPKYDRETQVSVPQTASLRKETPAIRKGQKWGLEDQVLTLLSRELVM